MPARSNLTISVSGTDRNVSQNVSLQQMNEQIPFGWRGDNELYNLLTINTSKRRAVWALFLNHTLQFGI